MPPVTRAGPRARRSAGTATPLLPSCSVAQAQDRAITDLRHEFERRARDLQARYDDRIKRLHKTLEDERKEETALLERRKDRHIQELMKSHELAFSKIKNYYNDITHNNLDLIRVRPASQPAAGVAGSLVR